MLVRAAAGPVAATGVGTAVEAEIPPGRVATARLLGRAGLPPSAFVAVDGDDRYWHRRTNGDDPDRMVVQEWLPRLAELGLAARTSDRVAFLGWSMGGYGSLLLASPLGPTRVAAVAAESPAIWQHSGQSAAGAFDNAADLAAHDLFRRTGVLRKILIRIDCGIADPFHTAAKKLAAELPDAAVNLGPGDHSAGYWRRRAPTSVWFVGEQLART